MPLVNYNCGSDHERDTTIGGKIQKKKNDSIYEKRIVTEISNIKIT